MKQVGKIYESTDGFLWVYRDSSESAGNNQDAIGARYEHEIEQIEFMKRIVTKDTVFIDVGAHVGYYAVRLAKQAKRMVVFEPNPFNYTALMTNMYLNGILEPCPELPSVELHRIGCSDVKKTVTLFDRGGGSFTNDLEAEPGDGECAHRIEVELQPLEEYVKDISAPMILKIDTEGAEMNVLNGVKTPFERENTIWMIEHHEGVYGTCNGRKAELTQYMKERGFRLMTQDETRITCKDDLLFCNENRILI